MYLCLCYAYNSYSNASGTLTSFKTGISSVSGNTSGDGFFTTLLQSINLPKGVLRFIIGSTMQPLQVITAKTYYFIMQVTFTTVTVSNSPDTNVQSFVKLIRIA